MTELFKLITLLLLTALLLIGFSCTSETGEVRPAATEQIAKAEQFPLIYHMSFISRFTKKLWFSGIAENWALADIYNHEIEEIAEEIIEDGYTHRDVDISILMKAIMLPEIEQIEEAIDQQDRERFERRYHALIQSCNQCHASSNYGVVKITVPDLNPFNQDFSP